MKIEAEPCERVFSYEERGTRVVVSSFQGALDGVIKDFETFLRATGFEFDGKLGLVDDED